MLSDKQRMQALGQWGENKTLALLKHAGFMQERDVNAETCNHPFGDIYAERDGVRYLISVKTRNKFQTSGLLNPCYNVRKKGVDVLCIARRYHAQLAWVTVQVIPERQLFCSYFGTINQIQEHGERFSIPMQASATSRYECLADEERDLAIRPEWTNGGYSRSRERPLMSN